MIDSFVFHLTAAKVFLPQGFSLTCIDAGFVFSCGPPEVGSVRFHMLSSRLQGDFAPSDRMSCHSEMDC